MKKIVIFLILIVLFFHFKAFAEKSVPKIKKVLILPFKVYSEPKYSYLKEAIPEMLVSRLFSPSKIEIVDIEKAENEIKNYPKLNKEIVKELGEKFGADYVIWGSITVLGKSVSIDAQIIDLSGKKKPTQFFQDLKDISEIIPQLSKFAQKAKMYIEGKEYKVSKTYPERNYYTTSYYFYSKPFVERKPKVTRAKSPYINEEEGLTKNLVIDLSKGVIGWAENKKEKGTTNATTKMPKSSSMYPPQPYYSYSPPPYYYYKKDEGFFSRLWSHIWPFGRKKKTSKYYIVPAPQSCNSSKTSVETKRQILSITDNSTTEIKKSSKMSNQQVR